jgi:hypothetical protein
MFQIPTKKGEMVYRYDLGIGELKVLPLTQTNRRGNEMIVIKHCFQLCVCLVMTKYLAHSDSIEVQNYLQVNGTLHSQHRWCSGLVIRRAWAQSQSRYGILSSTLFKNLTTKEVVA